MRLVIYLAKFLNENVAWVYQTLIKVASTVVLVYVTFTRFVNGWEDLQVEFKANYVFFFLLLNKNKSKTQIIPNSLALVWNSPQCYWQFVQFWHLSLKMSDFLCVARAAFLIIAPPWLDIGEHFLLLLKAPSSLLSRRGFEIDAWWLSL